MTDTAITISICRSPSTANRAACHRAGRSRNWFADIGLDPKKVAVECNLEIVPRSTLAQVELRDGDVLEIVHFVGGG